MSHETVLLKEAVDSLVQNPDGVYLDATFGRGGHSREILSRLSPKGRLIALDQDPQAIEFAKQEFKDSRFAIHQSNFSEMANHLEKFSVSGVLMDLGVSSPQLDQAERGFSFLHDGPLDMRMNPQEGESASQWIARVKEAELAEVLKEYGEERFAKKIAREILAARTTKAIQRTHQLAEIIKTAHPRWEVGKHPATRSFQAIRIFINNELGNLDKALAASYEVLAVKGRLVVISFHSLEDRRVKTFIQRQSSRFDLPRDLPLRASEVMAKMARVGKSIRASNDEVNTNQRARSAVMRVAEKLG